jgi:mRNA interferase RelE/StbE
MPKGTQLPLNKRCWKVTFSPDASKTLKKLDRPIKTRVLKFIQQKLVNAENPRIYGKRLSYPLEEFWRYRVGDYRLIARFMENELIVDIIKVGHRKEVYEVVC